MDDISVQDRLNNGLGYLLNQHKALVIEILNGDHTDIKRAHLVNALEHTSFLAGVIAGAMAGVNILKDLEKWR